MRSLRQTRSLRDGWELAQSTPGAVDGPDRLDELAWKAASVPGTVAGAVDDLSVDPDACDWWFRTRFEADVCEPGTELVLCLDGIATVAEVFLNGEPILTSRSMFAAHEVDVSVLVRESNELAVCCRALTPQLRARSRPRARWRTALVDGGLRFFRTMLLGRAPGFAPGPAVVGLWRPVRLESRRGFVVDEVRLRPRVIGDRDGVLAVRLNGRTLGDTAPPRTLTVSLSGPTGMHNLTLVPSENEGRWAAEGELDVAAVALWWPHTHGEPTLYDVAIAEDGLELHQGHVGFRSLEWPPNWEQSGLALRVNGVDVFARGAVWTPLDMRAPDQPETVVRRALEQVVTAGMNMVRIAGVGCYESDVFHDLCDELGIMVWQDLMLANLDYPSEEPDWGSEFEAEGRQELGRLAGRPSLAVICGGSEVAQQVAMLGLDPELGRGRLYTETIPRLIEEVDAAVPYVPNSPWGGTLPFRPDRGVANYYGVGAYLRDLSDARLADVKFAGECLAFSNMPDDVSLERIEESRGLPHHPAWKAGVPRDAGAGWDFEDVRDHYLRTLYGEDAVQLRWSELPRYLELSRAVTGEVMADVFGEWRRAGSSCAGGLVLWLRDLRPGAGWGIIDHDGRPKAAYHHLRRALAPVAVWLTDEGLGGMEVHLANDRSAPLKAQLRITLYRYLREPVGRASLSVVVPAHGSATYNVEDLLGRFVDVNFAYGFGPPGHDVVVASLECGGQPGEALIGNAFRFPGERPSRPETAASLGIEAKLTIGSRDTAELILQSNKLVHGLRVDAPGWIPADDAFTLEPGIERTVALRQEDGVDEAGTRLSLSAVNLSEGVRITSS